MQLKEANDTAEHSLAEQVWAALNTPQAQTDSASPSSRELVLD